MSYHRLVLSHWYRLCFDIIIRFLDFLQPMSPSQYLLAFTVLTKGSANAFRSPLRSVSIAVDNGATWTVPSQHPIWVCTAASISITWTQITAKRKKCVICLYFSAIQCTLFILRTISMIARFLGPTWGPSGDDRTQVGFVLAHELCHLGIECRV